MNDEIKLKCCNYVYIYVNVLRNQDFKEFLFKETVTSDLQCKYTSKLNLNRVDIWQSLMYIWLMAECRPMPLMCTCISAHTWVILETAMFQKKKLVKYPWRNPFLRKTADWWDATKTTVRKKRFPGYFPNFAEQLFCRTPERCCLSILFHGCF